MRASIKLLHPVAADVAHACLGVARDDLRERDEGATVVWPAGEDGERVEVDLIAREDDVLTRAAGHGARRDVGELGEAQGKLRQLARAGRGACVDELFDAACVLLEIAHAKRQRHAGARAEGVDEERERSPGGALEEQRWAGRLDDAIGERRDLEARIHPAADPHELTALFQSANERAHAVPRHPDLLARAPPARLTSKGFKIL